MQKPKPTTAEHEREQALKALCDEILFRAVKMMTEDAGAPIEMVLDRIITYSAAQSCKIAGSPRTAEVFRDVADKIDAGLFHRVTGEGDADSARH